jgi:hypothetical protein
MFHVETLNLTEKLTNHFTVVFGETYAYPLPLDEDRKVILTIKSN